MLRFCRQWEVKPAANVAKDPASSERPPVENPESVPDDFQDCHSCPKCAKRCNDAEATPMTPSFPEDSKEYCYVTSFIAKLNGLNVVPSAMQNVRVDRHQCKIVRKIAFHFRKLLQMFTWSTTNF